MFSFTNPQIIPVLLIVNGTNEPNGLARGATSRIAEVRYPQETTKGVFESIAWFRQSPLIETNCALALSLPKVT